MPRIYLSPSTQEYNIYPDGNSEEYYMNLVANAMMPYFIASNIQYIRNLPAMTTRQSIEAANAGNYDLYLAVHSNAAPDNAKGTKRGPEVYYYPTSEQGRRAAEIFAKNLRNIYPNPDLVKLVPNDTLLELVETTAPAVHVEVAYHDNPEDVRWITENTALIGMNLAESTAEFLGVNLSEPSINRQGVVNISSGTLNMRSAPSTNASVIKTLANGAPVLVIRSQPGWYFIEHEGDRGYVGSQYIRL